MKYLYLIAIMLTACQPINAESPHDHDTIEPINRDYWQGKQPYPFVDDRGEIACVSGEVYYFPFDDFDKGKDGYLLNTQRASDLKGVVKDGADLSEMVAWGMDICGQSKR